jgi:uncharacterized protein YqjF (DUF2071 family)
MAEATPPNNILQKQEHRPYPMPNPKSWLMYQSWQRLLFAHWPISASQLRDKIPSELAIDEYDGTAWIGVVPFRMANVRFRGLPQIWGTNRFPELNLRTYVKKDGYAGVWFFSLDAANPLAVIGAKIAFHLPYYLARMSIQENQSQTRYESRRKGAEFVGDYLPTGEIQDYAADSLETWLTERYCLFAADGHDKVYRGDIQHQRWPLQPAEADISINTIAAASGLVLPDTKPHLLYAESIDVLAWYIG